MADDARQDDDVAVRRALGALPRDVSPPEDWWPTVRGRLAPRVRRVWWRAPRARIAALLAVTALSLVALARDRALGGRWRLATLAGAPVAPRPVAAGEVLATDPAGRLLLEVGTIGHVEVDTATTVRLLEARATRQRLALDRGTIHATISAPPRLFVVETPSGTAWDLGCAYTLTVDSTGTSRLRVTLGWVAFASGRHESLVPEGFSVVTYRGARPGTPVADDAAVSFAATVAAFDGGDTTALEPLLGASRAGDAITLWHLLARTDGAARAAVAARLEALVPPPPGVTRERILALDRMALRLWWQRLPGALEVLPSWTRTIWTWWLRAFG